MRRDISILLLVALVEVEADTEQYSFIQLMTSLVTFFCPYFLHACWKGITRYKVPLLCQWVPSLKTKPNVSG